GISRQESHNVLHNLLITLCLTYVIMLGVLYFIITYVASKAIQPVQQLIFSAKGINDFGINSRLPLPANQDELYHLATTFNDLLKRLEINVRQQRQFTADASHEMRTPLAAIKGTLEVLIRKRRTPEQYEQKIQDVIIQTDRLSLIFDQLLQLSRLESSAITAKNEPILLAESVYKIIHMFIATDESLKARFNVSGLENAIVVADETLLERILENLISNAIKYNKSAGLVYISFDMNSMVLTIRDEGIGFSENHIAHLFDRFYRIDESRSSTIPGTGLGLSIVKKLCELQHIQITVKSILHKGTSFILTFRSM
ncbi:MAG: HAMP domain-containing histidine kinase, partial [Chitinophagales bacterium]|nr:HAMP domain-containing histidine kinase [Chitinophagales bacterium]